MSLAPIYYIEPQWEPDGPGNGWAPAPSDDAASVFCVVRREPGAPPGEESGYESVITSETSRRAAAGVIARLVAARRMEDERPPTPEPVKRRSMGVRFLMGLPFVILAWLISAVINRLT
jgi:hypothetical protein